MREIFSRTNSARSTKCRTARPAKLVVAANESEEPELEKLVQKGINNGVHGLKLVGPKEIHAREPHIHGTAAIDVPSTREFCRPEDLVRTHARLAADNGANIVTRAKVVALTPVKDAVRVDLEIGDEDSKEKESIEARCVISTPPACTPMKSPRCSATIRGRFIRSVASTAKCAARTRV